LADRVIDLAPQRAEREPAIRRFELEAGEAVFDQGDPADLVYVVDDGSIEVYRVRPDGTDDVLAEVTAGHYFGEIGPLLSLPRSASARATRPTRLTGFGPREFRSWSGGAAGTAPSEHNGAPLHPTAH
jgi:putative ABC transport system ATP-binding protein